MQASDNVPVPCLDDEPALAFVVLEVRNDHAGELVSFDLLYLVTEFHSSTPSLALYSPHHAPGPILGPILGQRCCTSSNLSRTIIAGG